MLNRDELGWGTLAAEFISVGARIYYKKNCGLPLSHRPLIHLAMKEGGIKLRNGKRVSSKAQVIQKLLEMA